MQQRSSSRKPGDKAVHTETITQLDTQLQNTTNSRLAWRFTYTDNYGTKIYIELRHSRNVFTDLKDTLLTATEITFKYRNSTAGTIFIHDIAAHDNVHSMTAQVRYCFESKVNILK